MSKERNYLRRIIALRIHTEPFGEFTAGVHATRAPPPLPRRLGRKRIPLPVFPAAPPVAGLPLRDGAREQRRGLHEEELPRDARLHEALQPAHHPAGRAHAEVRHARHAKRERARPAFTSRPFSFRFLFFFFPFPPPSPPLPPCTPCITIPSTDSGSKYGRFVCADSKHLLPDDIDSNLGGFDSRA